MNLSDRFILIASWEFNEIKMKRIYFLDLLIPWRYPILFNLIVIKFILFILSVLSPVSNYSDETVVCHSNILWLKIIH